MTVDASPWMIIAVPGCKSKRWLHKYYGEHGNFLYSVISLVRENDNGNGDTCRAVSRVRKWCDKLGIGEG